MVEILDAITKIWNVLIFGTMTPESNGILMQFFYIENLKYSIEFNTYILSKITIALIAVLMIYYLFDVVIILFKRFTK